MPEWIFSGWEPSLRTVVVGVASYVALIAVLRFSGKRTLSKLNAFDLVVTVALGSTVATILLNRDVALVEGLVALSLLVGLQFVVAFLNVRSPGFASVVRSEPTLLVRHGELLHAAMRRERIAESEVEEAARKSGVGRLDDVDAMILESDGTLSVVSPMPTEHRSINAGRST